MALFPDSPVLPIVLSFGATDPCCGSGVQGDALTVSALGAHPLSVVTAITIQDTSGIEAVQPVDSDWVSDQARALLEDMPVQAFKVGMLGGIDCVELVAEVLADYPDIPVVFDPTASGNETETDPFEDEELNQAIWELIVPLTTVLTLGSREVLRFSPTGGDGDPDGGEGEIDRNESGEPPIFLGDDVDDAEQSDVAQCARHLIVTGARHVLVTGTHEQTPQVVNTLFGPMGVIRADAWERLPGSYVGARATLSAAIAALLARGVEVSEAVHLAQQFVWTSLAQGTRLGMGRTMPNRFHGRTVK